MDAPLYLYVGPEIGERNEQVAKTKEELKKKYGSSDDFLYYGNDLDMNEVAGQLMTESLFTPATCVVIRNAEFIKDKNDVELIADWAESAARKGSDSSVLILVSDETKIDARLEKLVPSSHKKIFWEMFEDRKEQWLHDFFRKNGYVLEEDAAEQILEMVENNTEQLKNECSRFFMCFPKGHSVSTADVEQILAHNREESAFTLFDAMIQNLPPAKRLENCLSIMQKIMLVKDNNPVKVIAGLTSCFRRLALWKSLYASGANPGEDTLKKSGFSSKIARRQYTAASRMWSAGQVAAINALLSRTDMSLRQDGQTFQATAMSLLVYEIVIKNGSACAQYEAS
ncbi:MAG: DNA polymerase III subunit delta [Treponema sp.]|nr:DNA polymerase III subunit delta [Treponema sp.]